MHPQIFRRASGVNCGTHNGCQAAVRRACRTTCMPIAHTVRCRVLMTACNERILLAFCNQVPLFKNRTCDQDPDQKTRVARVQQPDNSSWLHTWVHDAASLHHTSAPLHHHRKVWLLHMASPRSGMQQQPHIARCSPKSIVRVANGLTPVHGRDVLSTDTLKLACNPEASSDCISLTHIYRHCFDSQGQRVTGSTTAQQQATPTNQQATPTHNSQLLSKVACRKRLRNLKHKLQGQTMSCA